MPRIAPQVALLSLVAALAPGFSAGQSGTQLGLAGTSATGPSAISQVKLLPDKSLPALEITSTRQIIPTITRMDSPPRLIIDLPDAELSVRRKRIEIHSGDITAVRLAQYPLTPPVVQVIVNLAKPRGYTWEAAGNRLIVRLQEQKEQEQGRQGEEEEGATAKPAKSALATGVEPIVVPVSVPNTRPVVFLKNLSPGAFLSAGADTTVLRLIRGEVEICPGTTVSVHRSQDPPEMMLALSTGALETHYTLERTTDSILTPDFRILLRGPGEFHYAIRVDSRGNACVRTLPLNTGRLTVSELIGNGEHEVSSGDRIIFHAGRFTDIDTASTESCGCSAPATPPKRPFSLPAPETAPLPSFSPREIHVQVYVPLMFPDHRRAEDKPTESAESRNQPPVEHPPQTGPPAGVAPVISLERTQGKASRPGFFGKLRSFMTGCFDRTRRGM